MQDEITKLYSLAGVEPIHSDECKLADKFWNNEELANEYGTFDGYLAFNCPHQNEGCYSTCEYAYDKDTYSPFTAEKQIAIIKWLAIKGDFDYTLDIAKNTEAYYTMYFDGTRWTEETFEETLAGLINSMWNKLTEAEQNEIKNILKG